MNEQTGLVDDLLLSERITIRCSREERNALMVKAASVGLKTSAYCRSILFENKALKASLSESEISPERVGGKGLFPDFQKRVLRMVEMVESGMENYAEDGKNELVLATISRQLESIADGIDRLAGGGEKKSGKKTRTKAKPTRKVQPEEEGFFTDDDFKF